MGKYARGLLAASACLAALGAAAAPAAAGSLQVDPIRLEIGQGRRTATLRVHNEEQAPVTIRAYALAWSQVDGEDRYEDTVSVIVSPPVFTIPAGGTQLVRIGLRSADADNQAYRIIVEEVPEASPGGIQVALRLNLPLFAGIARGDVAQVRWTAHRDADGRWAVEAANPGTGYVRLEATDVAAATGVSPEGIGFGVVLPGSSRRWILGDSPTVTNRERFTAIMRADDGAQAASTLR